MRGEKISEAVRPGRGVHTRYGVEAEGCVQFIHSLEERNELFSVKRFISYYPGNDDAEQTKLLDGAPRFFGSRRGILNRHESDTAQSPRRSRALLSDVIIVGAAGGGCQFLVFQVENPDQSRGVDHLKINCHLVQVLEPAFDVVERVVFGSHLGVARRLISETTAANAFRDGKTRDEPSLDQPAPFVSLLVAQFHHARTHGIEFFLYITFKEIERLM